MSRRRETSIEAYKAAGAAMRLLRDAGNNAVAQVSELLPLKETDRLVYLLNKIENLTSKMDTQMFTDHPELSGVYTDVFYGNLSDTPRTDVDAEVIQLAKEQMESRFVKAVKIE